MDINPNPSEAAIKHLSSVFITNNPRSLWLKILHLISDALFNKFTSIHCAVRKSICAPNSGRPSRRNYRWFMKCSIHASGRNQRKYPVEYALMEFACE
jgi:hypothetical protein